MVDNLDRSVSNLILQNEKSNHEFKFIILNALRLQKYGPYKKNIKKQKLFQISSCEPNAFPISIITPKNLKLNSLDPKQFDTNLFQIQGRIIGESHLIDCHPHDFQIVKLRNTYSDEKFVEIWEIAIGLEYVEEVEGELQWLFVVVTEGTGYCP